MPLGALLLWQAGSSAGWWSTYILPGPIAVLQVLEEMVQSGELWKNVAVSLIRVIIGFLLAACTAVPLATAIGLSPKAYRLFQPTVEFFRHVPPLAMLPMIILWFGIGEGSKLAIVFLATFYPIFLNTLTGIRATDRHFIELGKQYGLSQGALFFHIRLPQAAPYLFAGLRLGLGYSWRSLIGAEMIAAASGLGYLILDAEAVARSDIVLAGIFLIGFCGMLMDRLFCGCAHILFGKYLEKGAAQYDYD